MKTNLSEHQKEESGWKARLDGKRGVASPLVWAALSVFLVGLIASAIGWRRLPSFDGAMNLQVARHLADVGRYGRFYEGFELFPSEVQTNGIPLLVGALSIKIWGLTEFALQVPNIIFLVLLSALFALLAWPDRRLVIIAPLLLLGVPAIWRFGLSGYGEIPTFTFQLSSLLLLARGLSSQERTIQQRYQLIAFLLAGAAVVTKAIGLSVLPALVGMVAVHRVARREANWTLDLASLATLALPVAAFEVFRLAQMGSLGAYLAYWDYAVERIGYQSGLSAQEGPVSLWSSLRDRTGTLGAMFGLGRAFAVAFVALPLGVAVHALSRTLKRAYRRTERDNSLNLALVGLAVFVGCYFAWWFFITPLEKAWPRRILIAVLAVYAMYVLSLRWMSRLNKGRRTGFVAVLIFLALAVVPRIGTSVNVTDHWSKLPEFRAAIDYVDSTPGSPRFYGYHWWSAPQIALYSDRKVADLSVLPPCEIAGQDAYVIWDGYASAILSPRPPTRDSQLEYSLVAEFEGAADIYSVRPAEGLCGDQAG